MIDRLQTSFRAAAGFCFKKKQHPGWGAVRVFNGDRPVRNTIFAYSDAENTLNLAKQQGKICCYSFLRLYWSGSFELFGAEALLRFRSPSRGLVRPDEFTPILEQSGLIVEVGDCIFL